MEIKMNRFWIGVDIAKLKFDVSIIFQDKKSLHKVFENNTKGFKEFSEWLTYLEIKNAHICLEATGIYSQAFAYFMHTLQHKVSIVNPARIKAFSTSEGIRNKTDKVDAGIIARFCKAQNPKAWVPPSKNRYELQNLYRCLQNLQEDCQRIANRLEGKLGKSDFVNLTWEKSLKDINCRIEEIEQHLKDLLNGDNELKEQVELLESIPGIGNKTAVAILAELPDVKNFKNAKEVAAFAGLTPKKRESGTSVRGKASLCKIGSAVLRKALFMPSLVAKRYNPTLKAFSEKLDQKGKNGMIIVAAVMRKLLHIIYGVLKNKKLFTAI